MNILLERPITEKPKKEGIVWIKMSASRIERFHINAFYLKNWHGFTEKCICWYEEITLPDDTIIAQ